MKKRKSTITNMSPLKKDGLSYGRIKGRRPAARDGCTSVVFNHQLIIFGGDRHHMPFCDTSLLDIR